MHHRLKRFAAAAALMLAASSALAGRIEDIKARGYVRIGVSLGGEPVGFRNASNEPVGYDVDVARALAAKLGVPVRFSDVSSDARISMLRSGQLDLVVANVSITPQRARVVDFSIPYNAAGLRVIAQKSAKVRTLSDLNGKRVVVGRGTTADAFLRQSAPLAVAVYTDNFAPDGVLLLQQKRVDAGIEDSSLLDYLASRNAQLETLPHDVRQYADRHCDGEGRHGAAEIRERIRFRLHQVRRIRGQLQEVVGRQGCTTGAGAAGLSGISR